MKTGKIVFHPILLSMDIEQFTISDDFLIKILVEWLKTRPDSVKEAIFHSFCQHCYRYLEPEERCCCWNDE